MPGLKHGLASHCSGAQAKFGVTWPVGPTYRAPIRTVLAPALATTLTNGSFISSYLPAVKPAVDFASYGPSIVNVTGPIKICVFNCPGCAGSVYCQALPPPPPPSPPPPSPPPPLPPPSPPPPSPPPPPGVVPFGTGAPLPQLWHLSSYITLFVRTFNSTQVRAGVLHCRLHSRLVSALKTIDCCIEQKLMQWRLPCPCSKPRSTWSSTSSSPRWW